MPIYRAKVKILLAHESRTVNEGDEFTTVFPKVKVDGKLVDMKLGSNLELVGYTVEDAAVIAEFQAEKERAARLQVEAEALKQIKATLNTDTIAALETSSVAALSTDEAPALSTDAVPALSTDQAPALKAAPVSRAKH